jgi:DNA repair exonuclease SbcCD ATPase subunit
MQARVLEERTLRDKLESAIRYNTNIETQLALHRETVGRVLAMLETERKTLVDLQAAIALELSVHQALGRQGYLGSIFDEILAEISTEVTDVLGNVPNVSGVTLRFDSTHETRKGATKRSIVPVVTKDGLEATFSSLSGGQQSSVELAVDLAIGNVIGRRTGRTPGWLILDESFDGLDVQAKEGCMAILKRYATNRLVAVIDHASELKELFDQRIQVQLHNGVSTVVA